MKLNRPEYPGRHKEFSRISLSRVMGTSDLKRELVGTVFSGYDERYIKP
jgi:hypothetical protein